MAAKFTGASWRSEEKVRGLKNRRHTWKNRQRGKNLVENCARKHLVLYHETDYRNNSHNSRRPSLWLLAEWWHLINCTMKDLHSAKGNTVKAILLSKNKYFTPQSPHTECNDRGAQELHTPNFVSTSEMLKKELKVCIETSVRSHIHRGYLSLAILG